MKIHKISLLVANSVYSHVVVVVVQDFKAEGADEISSVSLLLFLKQLLVFLICGGRTERTLHANFTHKL